MDKHKFEPCGLTHPDPGAWPILHCGKPGCDGLPPEAEVHQVATPSVDEQGKSLGEAGKDLSGGSSESRQVEGAAIAAEDSKEGWQEDRHYSQRVNHYIIDTFSLCGKLGFYTGGLMPDRPFKRDREDCKACIKKLDARKKPDTATP